MAYADWVFTSNNGNPFVTQPTLNSGLSNPLPQPFAGDFARLFPANSGNFGGWMTLSPSYAGGALYNVPNTKALRIQGCLRSAKTDVLSSPGRGLVVKSTTNTSEDSGYLLGIGSNPSVPGGSSTIRSINLGLPKDPDAGSPGSYGFNGRTVYPLINFDYCNNWISLRMDVFPIGASGDRIICSQETTATGSGVNSPGSGLTTSFRRRAATSRRGAATVVKASSTSAATTSLTFTSTS